MGCAKKMEFDFRLLSRLMARQGEQLAYHGDNRKLWSDENNNSCLRTTWLSLSRLSMTIQL